MGWEMKLSNSSKCFVGKSMVYQVLKEMWSKKNIFRLKTGPSPVTFFLKPFFYFLPFIFYQKSHTLRLGFQHFFFFKLYTSSSAQPVCGRGQTEPVCDTMLAATYQAHRLPQNCSTWCLVVHGNRMMFALIVIPKHCKYSKPPPLFRLQLAHIYYLHSIFLQKAKSAVLCEVSSLFILILTPVQKNLLFVLTSSNILRNWFNL